MHLRLEKKSDVYSACGSMEAKMRYALNSEGMKRIDEATIKVVGIPALVLMERAALETVHVMKKNLKREDRILVVCGPGNNGGDGVAAGRILFQQGYRVALLFICGEDKFSNQMKLQTEIARNLGMAVENNNKLDEYNIIIDAIFGVGLSRPVDGVYEDIIQEINGNEHTVYAIDIPSGISADTGNILNAAIRADYTITYGFMKRGLLLYPGVAYAGEITVADIGFPDCTLLGVHPDTFYYGTEDLKRLPARKDYSNKGTYGRVLTIAGSTGMSGAAYLSAKAAYRTGAGLVKILTCADNRTILQTLLPEALFAAYDSAGERLETELEESIAWASAIIIGPGLGRQKQAEELLELVLKKADVPVIFDADALNLLSERLDREGLNSAEDRLNRLTKLLPKDAILTPHLMELSRLTKIPVNIIRDNIIDTADHCSYNSKLIYAIKDARSVVTQEVRKYINVSGNNGMATGGSGDVLTGIIAALIAQGLCPYDAACLGVYLHGLAGDAAAKQKGTYSLIAGDIIDAIEKVLQNKEQLN